jgi:hypothetical protein
LEGSSHRLIEALSLYLLGGPEEIRDNLSDIAGALAETQNENLSNTSQKHWDLSHRVWY